MTKGTSNKAARILLVVGRLALAAVFLFAAYAKLKPPTGLPWSLSSVNTSLAMFALQVDSYELLPENAVSAVAHLLPPFELLLGLWLLSGIALRLSSVASSLLLGGFLSVMVRTYMRGLEINCGCFGPGERLGPVTLLRDSSLLLLAVAVMLGAFLVRRARAEQSPS